MRSLLSPLGKPNGIGIPAGQVVRKAVRLLQSYLPESQPSVRRSLLETVASFEIIPLVRDSIRKEIGPLRVKQRTPRGADSVQPFFPHLHVATP